MTDIRTNYCVACKEIADRIEELATEAAENARIIGMSAEREMAMRGEIERLREAVGILEDGLQEVGDDYPGSSCQEWCQHQIKQARAALGESHDQ